MNRYVYNGSKKKSANMHVFIQFFSGSIRNLPTGFDLKEKGARATNRPQDLSLAAESTVSPSSSSRGSSSSPFMVEVKHEASMPTLATATAMSKLFSSCQESDAYLMYKSGRSLQVIFTAKIRSLFVRDKPSNTTNYKWDSLIILPLLLWP